MQNYLRRTPFNNNNNNINIPPEEYRRNTPNNMKRMTLRNQYQIRTPMHNNGQLMEYPT